MVSAPAAVQLRLAELRAQGRPGFAGYLFVRAPSQGVSRACRKEPPYDTWVWEDWSWRLVSFGLRSGDEVWFWKHEDANKEPELYSVPVQLAKPGGAW